MFTILQCLLVIATLTSVASFQHSALLIRKQRNGVKSLTAVLDIIAEASLAVKLNSSPMILPNALSSSTVLVSKSETVQGMYKEYTVDRPDTSALDDARRTYKTAEETDDSKNKYWTILAVLLAGSFIVPMVQYYWYVADED